MSTESSRLTEEELIRAAVVRLRTGALALVFSLVGAAGLWFATVWLLVRGGPNVGQHLGLLGNYLPGYTVTWSGSFLGLFYGGVLGGTIGWLMATVYNRVVALRERTSGRRASRAPRRESGDEWARDRAP